MKTSVHISLALAAFTTLAFGPSLHAASFLKNPSFESNYNDASPHYGNIDDWVSAGGGGVNEDSGPFHNTGTAIPDGTRVAFKQGSGTLSQDVAGLTTGKLHWVQFYYDARGCCGGTIDVVLKWNDTELDKIPNVRPASGAAPAYYFRNVPFTPDSDAGTLTLQTVANGDATANFDAVTIVPRDTNDVIVANPSFEASGVPAGDGTLTPATLAGWTASGVYGVNVTGGAYADNGVNPDQDNVAFLQGAGSFSQIVSGLVTGTTYQVSFAYNAKTGTTPHLQVKVEDAVLFEEDVAAVGGTNPYRAKSVNFVATNTSATVTFAQTSSDATATLLLDDVRVTGQVIRELPPLNFEPASAEAGPGQRLAIQVTVPAEVLTDRAVDLQFSIDRTDLATLVNADTNGVLTLHYDKGGTNVQTLTIEAVARGQARLVAVDTAGLKVVQDVKVDVIASFVRNSSFESSPVPGGVGYSSILSWNGGSGLNNSAGPFADNGQIPDRDQVAFVQNSGTLSQQIFGLVSGKNYWLQFRYNARNCCGGTLNLSVKFDGQELAKIDAITAVGAQEPYYFTNLSFIPASASGLLEFTTTVTGDATLLLDAVSIVQRDNAEVVIENPSFEATGNPVGVGYLGPKKIAGWDITGGYGINVDEAGPFTDNGDAPDQDRVLLIQNAATLMQNVTGLTAGQKYTLIYSVNRRTCCNGPTLTHTVTFDNQPLVTDEEVLPVGAANPYLTKFLIFTPAGTEGVLQFTTQVQGDGTFLIDDVHIVRGEVTPPGPALGASVEAGGIVRVAWPASAADLRLQSVSKLTGTWADVGSPVTVEGTENVVREMITGGSRFYRLIK